MCMSPSPSRSLALKQWCLISRSVVVSHLRYLNKIILVRSDIYDAYVAVLDRNRILFRLVFREHHRVRRAIALSFCLGRGSYALCGCIRYSCIYIVCMNPTLSGSTALQRVKLGNALEIRNRIIFDFYSGLPHIQIVQGKCFDIMRKAWAISTIGMVWRSCWTTVNWTGVLLYEFKAEYVAFEQASLNLYEV